MPTLLGFIKLNIFKHRNIEFKFLFLINLTVRKDDSILSITRRKRQLGQKYCGVFFVENACQFSPMLFSKSKPTTAYQSTLCCLMIFIHFV